ncbi:clotting factor B-like [Parasteatoda tepidariorum]|uniref:clotting factor B-like n=1 Tax=Parasteatoda tepidariorum TaxID=114398 RepID=UPI00077FAA1F
MWWQIIIFINSILILFSQAKQLSNVAANVGENCRINHQSRSFENTGNLTYRVKGGANTSIRTWPWMAGVYFVNSEDPNFFKFSGDASIIAEKYLLTVAHVLMDGKGVLMEPQNLAVLVGCALKNRGFRFDVQNVYIHPEFEITNGQNNDIGIIELTALLTFSDAIKPIGLPSYLEKFPNYQDRIFTTVGWGYTSENYDDSSVLKKVTIPIVSEEICHRAALSADVPFPTINFICGGDQEGNRPCKGDSGGPLMTKEKGKIIIIGLVDFFLGDKTVCGTPGTPFYFLRVAPYLKWIYNVVNPNVTLVLPKTQT